MREITLSIEKIAIGGAGFGHHEGKACFISGAVPGDHVRASVNREKKSYIEAEVTELLYPSPRRIAPRCPVFGKCGGCTLQLLSYQDQICHKEELFAEQLFRFARVSRERIAPMIPSPASWGYRSRVQVKVRCIDGSLKVGFYRPGTHFVVPFPGECAIASPVINRVIHELVPLLACSPEPDRVPQVDLSVGEDGDAIAIFHYIGQSREMFASFLEDRGGTALPSVAGVWIQCGRKESLWKVRGIERLEYDVPTGGHEDDTGPLRLSFSRGGFSQVNYIQNATLVRLVCEVAQLSGSERVLDLYCGNGNFSIPLARLTGSVMGIDEFATSIEDAIRNSLTNGTANASFRCDDSIGTVERFANQGERFDLVLLDPPRSGARDLMQLIPRLGPKTILYVSCDPVTLARDVAILQNFNYSLERSIPVDMFPQTHHIESVTILNRC